jgi:two-component system response regulator AtoC
MQQNAILFVDDDGEALVSLTRALKAAGLTAPCIGASSIPKALELIAAGCPPVAVLDLSIDPARGVESGYDLLKTILERSPTTRVIILTGHGGKRYGIRALELGAAHFLEKPAEIQHLYVLLCEALKHAALLTELRALRATRDNSLVGTSAAMEEVRAKIAFAASTNQPILLLGETGTGKGACAKEIHKLSARHNGRLARYQPTGGGSDLTNSDLFGHRKGSFTGAINDKRGLITEADAGTLFLDEIDQLPKETQVALLGVLQDREVRPLGATTPDRVDFRLIAATNGNLADLVASGAFRKDLYHRIAHYTITLPPLRDRKEDIAQLALHFISVTAQRERLNVFSLTNEALTLCQSYSWPGNIRELEAVIEGGVYHAAYRGSSTIDSNDLSLSHAPSQSSSQPSHSSTSSFAEQVEAYKRLLIEDALKKSGGNQVEAAALLQMERSTLRRILARTGGN